jgi:hypothetical protein
MKFFNEWLKLKKIKRLIPYFKNNEKSRVISEVLRCRN